MGTLDATADPADRGVRMRRLVSAALVLVLGASTAHATETIHQLAGRAGSEAQKRRSDARLVQIEVPSFSLALGPSGLPDMSRVGPPAIVIFHYLSPSTRRQVRVVVRADLSPTQPGFLGVEELAYPASPYALPIPDTFIELDRALATAQATGFARECAGVNVHYGCDRVTLAELHVYAPGRGASGTPIWTFTFGQDARARMITRHVDALTGGVVMVDEGSVVPAISPVSVRVQLSEQKNAPTVTSIRDGQTVWVFLSARFNTRAVNPEACFVFVLGSTGREAGRSCQKSDVSTDAGGVNIGSQLELTPHLPATRSADVLEITGSVTANGVIERGHASLEIHR
jgi:hypothetical protein